MSSKSFQKGLESYEAGNYQEALGHLIEAVDSGGQKSFHILDIRGAVYAKLGQYEDALKDARQTIEIAPEQWRGYARAAYIFLLLHQIESAQTMMKMVLERLKETETGKCVLLERHALDVCRKPITDHINQLPIEVFGDIARIVVEDDHTALIPLLHICKHWRRVIENTPCLWAKLVLTSWRPKPKAKLWIEKANGEVKDLVVRSGASCSSNWPGNSLEGLRWDDLLAFHSEGWAFLPHLQAIGKEAAIARWIGLTVEDIDALPMDGEWGPFSLHSLTMNRTPLKIIGTKNFERLTTLRSCIIHSCFTNGSWANVLKANPLLERLELNTLTSVHKTPLPNVLKLEHLTTLEADFSAPIDIFTARMPHLRNLKLVFPHYDTDVFIQHLVDMLVEGLTELKLHGCMLNDSTNLLRLLRLSPNLQVLEVTNLTFQVVSLLNGLAAHYTTPPTLLLHYSPTADPSPILCPKLTHVNFSGCSEVRAGLLMRFIESRLIGQQSVVLQATSQIQTTHVSKIESLTIDFCHNVERKWVARMEELVPCVSCR